MRKGQRWVAVDQLIEVRTDLIALVFIDGDLVVNLREAGLVVSTRGAHGGYELTRAPSLIPMGQVLRALEGPIAPMFCATDDPEHALTCDRSSRCTVNILWVRVRDAITSTLDSMTLADLAPERVGALDDPQGALISQ